MRVQVYKSILEIGPEQWSRVADARFPFSTYHYLSSLETSDCLGQRTGWFPYFMTAWDGTELIAALVLYLKLNSYGEYIFDFAWADAYQRTGVDYFPKLTSAIPFTPATGPKILGNPSAAPVLLREVDQLAESVNASSLHALFVPREQLPLYAEAEYFLRHSFQFHWENHDYHSFADFTAALKSKRRKEILRERAQVANANVEIMRLTGAQLNEQHGDMFHQFYLSTIDKRNSYDYLTKDFFRSVFKTMGDQILLVLAANAKQEAVAGALNYIGTETLYGRNWGCLDEFKSLHFELCYYQGIEFAIERGLKTFEAGAQGEHKLQRGFLPSLTYSAHKVKHPLLNRAIRDHVDHEILELRKVFKHYEAHSPFAAKV